MLFASLNALKMEPRSTAKPHQMFLIVTMPITIMIRLIVSHIYSYKSWFILVINKICLPDYDKLPEVVKDKYNNMIGKIGIDDVA